MNKKLISACIVLFFLIISVGIVSAEDGDVKSIQVNATGDMPDAITVSLLCDGKVVDSATLSSGNSWSTTFNVNDDGDYSVVVKDNPDYSMSVSGDRENGFVVISKHLGEKLSAGNDTPVKENDSLDNTSVVNNISDVNVTDDNATEDNGTDDSNSTAPNNVIGNSTDKNINKTDKDINKSIVNKNVIKNKTVKQETKKPVEKKDNKTNKVKLRNTGLPLVVLVIAAFVVIFIPISRKK